MVEPSRVLIGATLNAIGEAFATPCLMAAVCLLMLHINGKPLEASLLHLAPDVDEITLAELARRQVECHLD